LKKKVLEFNEKLVYPVNNENPDFSSDDGF
jgi:hypothetical protein